MVCRVLLLARVKGTDRHVGGVDDAAHRFANPRDNKKHRRAVKPKRKTLPRQMA
jgi:hypothetical protein